MEKKSPCALDTRLSKNLREKSMRAFSEGEIYILSSSIDDAFLSHTRATGDVKRLRWLMTKEKTRWSFPSTTAPSTLSYVANNLECFVFFLAPKLSAIFSMTIFIFFRFSFDTNFTIEFLSNFCFVYKKLIKNDFATF